MLEDVAVETGFRGDQRFAEPIPRLDPFFRRSHAATSFSRGARSYPGALDRPIAAPCPLLPTIPMGFASLRSFCPRFQLVAVAGPFWSQLRQDNNAGSHSYTGIASPDAILLCYFAELNAGGTGHSN